MTSPDDIEIKLKDALVECARLREENERLKALLGVQEERPSGQSTPATVTNDSPPDSKIALFRSLFLGRDDVYPVRWEGKNGKTGYSPACANEWDRALCGKPGVKCSECENRKLLPITDHIIHNHLTGRHTIGVYPMLQDETCCFLAVDFDKVGWQEDVTAFIKTAKDMTIPVALERSRSGNGGHVWIFFESPIPAVLARKLGSAILTSTMDRRRQIGLDSYDRFFPNQDTMPRGGFGNLIALPLQRAPREKGNAVFLDERISPYPDQWYFLSTIRKMKLEEVERIVRDSARKDGIVSVRMSVMEDDEEDPWTLTPSAKRKPWGTEKPIDSPLPETVKIVLGNMVYIEKKGLPDVVLNRLQRLAAFQNPEFYRAQAMRLSTFDKPRIISCAEEFPKHIGLPRGCLEEVIAFLEGNQVKVDVADERFTGNPIRVVFQGELRPLQEEASNAILMHDTGILSAATAFGKTVVAAWLIAARKVNTLVLVHRRHLMDQWYERLNMFLKPEDGVTVIGQIGGGKDKSTGIIDIGIIQSLTRKGTVKDMVSGYGQVIVDECHHISAFSFEQVLKEAKARYIVGLTATPQRKDGHHPIIVMQCGRVRYRVDAKEQAALRPFEHVVVPRHTSFRMPTMDKTGIQDIYAALAEDKRRNETIFDDVLKALTAGRSPLILTERTGHVEKLAEMLKNFAKNIVVLKGGMGKKKRNEAAGRLSAIPGDEERVIIATGRYIGEGFDDARLDTLFLAMPISWRGTLQQYAGRLHRFNEGKKVVQIYDYIDKDVPVLSRMYEKRIRGYKSMGYALQGK